jgi:hypothetical protein
MRAWLAHFSVYSPLELQTFRARLRRACGN